MKAEAKLFIAAISGRLAEKVSEVVQKTANSTLAIGATSQCGIHVSLAAGCAALGTAALLIDKNTIHNESELGKKVVFSDQALLFSALLMARCCDHGNCETTPENFMLAAEDFKKLTGQDAALYVNADLLNSARKIVSYPREVGLVMLENLLKDHRDRGSAQH